MPNRSQSALLRHTPVSLIQIVMISGAFFRTRNNVIPVPDGALAANADIKHDRPGTQVPASIWFPHAKADTPLREMKVHAEQYGVVLSLLHLPRSADVWPPWAEEE